MKHRKSIAIVVIIFCCLGGAYWYGNNTPTKPTPAVPKKNHTGKIIVGAIIGLAVPVLCWRFYKFYKRKPDFKPPGNTPKKKQPPKLRSTNQPYKPQSLSDWLKQKKQEWPDRLKTKKGSELPKTKKRLGEDQKLKWEGKRKEWLESKAPQLQRALEKERKLKEVLQETQKKTDTFLRMGWRESMGRPLAKESRLKEDISLIRREIAELKEEKRAINRAHQKGYLKDGIYKKNSSWEEINNKLRNVIKKNEGQRKQQTNAHMEQKTLRKRYLLETEERFILPKKSKKENPLNGTKNDNIKRDLINETNKIRSEIRGPVNVRKKRNFVKKTEQKKTKTDEEISLAKKREKNLIKKLNTQHKLTNELIARRDSEKRIYLKVMQSVKKERELQAALDKQQASLEKLYKKQKLLNTVIERKKAEIKRDSIPAGKDLKKLKKNLRQSNAELEGFKAHMEKEKIGNKFREAVYSNKAKRIAETLPPLGAISIPAKVMMGRSSHFSQKPDTPWTIEIDGKSIDVTLGKFLGTGGTKQAYLLKSSDPRLNGKVLILPAEVSLAVFTRCMEEELRGSAIFTELGIPNVQSKGVVAYEKESPDKKFHTCIYEDYNSLASKNQFVFDVKNNNSGHFRPKKITIVPGGLTATLNAETWIPKIEPLAAHLHLLIQKEKGGFLDRDTLNLLYTLEPDGTWKIDIFGFDFSSKSHLMEENVPCNKDHFRSAMESILYEVMHNQMDYHNKQETIPLEVYRTRLPETVKQITDIYVKRYFPHE